MHAGDVTGDKMIINCNEDVFYIYIYKKPAKNIDSQIIRHTNLDKEKTNEQACRYTNTYQARHDGGKDKFSSEYKRVNSCRNSLESLSIVNGFP